MKRTVATLTLLILLLPATVAAAGGNLDLKGHDILDVNEVTFTNGSGIDANLPGGGLGLMPTGDTAIVMRTANGYVRILTGSIDPSVTGADANPGSLYLRNYQTPDNQNLGAAYIKTGPAPTDWQRIGP